MDAMDQSQHTRTWLPGFEMKEVNAFLSAPLLCQACYSHHTYPYTGIDMMGRKSIKLIRKALKWTDRIKPRENRQQETMGITGKNGMVTIVSSNILLK